MSLLVKRNGNAFPSLLTDLLDGERFFTKDLLNFNDAFFKNSFAKVPSANITEREKDFLIELAAPGLDKKDFKVELENDVLTISAEKEEKKEEKDGEITSKEFSYESFSRSFRLPENSKADTTQAQYENGILKIAIPKKEVAVIKPKKEIAVQ